MKVTFEIDCGLSNSNGPNIQLLLNKKNILETKLTKCSKLSIIIDNSQDSLVSIVHKDKKDSDTIVRNGSIVADKYIEIKKIWVDDILLLDQFCFTYCFPVYSQSYLMSVQFKPPSTLYSNNLYFNGTLEYTFEKNFFNWYYLYLKELDMQYLSKHSDSEAEQKFLGYDQESEAEYEIIRILEANGYCITN